MTRGEPFKRCGCKDPNRKNLNNRCPRLKQRDHGAWYYRFSEPAGRNGRRRQPLIGPFPTKTVAANDQTERANRLNQGLYDHADRALTVAEDFDRWLENKSSLKPGTRRGYEEHGLLYIKPGIGHVQLVDVRPQHLEDLYAAVRLIGRPPASTAKRQPATLLRLLEARQRGPSSARPISPATLKRIHATVHVYFNTRYRQQVIARNPAAHVELASGRAPRALVWTPERVERWIRTDRRPSPVMVWTPEQTGLFLDFAGHDPLYAMWRLIAFRGLRRGEACALDRSELSLTRASVSIRASIEDEDDLDTHDPGTTKNRLDRTAALDKGTVQDLTVYRQNQLRLQERWGALYHDSGMVFTSDDGRGLKPNTVSQRFDRLVARYEKLRRAPERARAAGRNPPSAQTLANSYRIPLEAVELALTGPPLPTIRLHDLRHVAACLTYRATKDLKLVSQLMGHSSIQITADIYTSLFEDVDRDAAEAVAAIVPRLQDDHTSNQPTTTDDPDHDLENDHTIDDHRAGCDDDEPERQ